MTQFTFLQFCNKCKETISQKCKNSTLIQFSTPNFIKITKIIFNNKRTEIHQKIRIMIAIMMMMMLIMILSVVTNQLESKCQFSTIIKFIYSLFDDVRIAIVYNLGLRTEIA